MNAVFYSLAAGGSTIAPTQLFHSLTSLRAFDQTTPVFVFVFGAPPDGFIEALQRLNAGVRHLGNYSDYVRRKHTEMGELFALDPKIHRWLVLEEPELKTCSRILYIDSDTQFFAPVADLFQLYRDADFYAREEPSCRRSVQGENADYLNEDQLAALCESEGVRRIPPFNTGVCLFNRQTADIITSILPRYFDNLFRFLSWFHLHPTAQREVGNSSVHAIYDAKFRPVTESAMPYPSQNRWIVDQIAMWMALGSQGDFRYADFSPTDIWQGGEFAQTSATMTLPILCHYFSPNTQPFFKWLDWLQTQPIRHRNPVS